MSEINLGQVSMAFGGQSVFAGISAQLNRGDHVGLVGPNGAGKTTLLNLIIGSLEPTSGSITRASGLRIGYLPQQTAYPPGQVVFDEVYSGLAELNRLRVLMLEAERKVTEAQQGDERKLNKAAMKYAELADRFESSGGSAAKGRVASVLNGLGIHERLWQSPMEQLSGGERNLVGLARILVGQHDVMLLDEPGNHLDFAGLDWLERYLQACGQAFIIVSHNRYTLDRVCTRIWEINRGTLEDYTGNYSEFRSVKLSRQLAQEAAYRRAQKEINRLEFNIQRLKAWSSVYDNPKLAKTAKQFERRVEALSAVEKPAADAKSIRFKLTTKAPKGDIALDVAGYTKQFEDGMVLLKDVHFFVAQGERVAFIGDNGTGKSSLLKDIISKGGWNNYELRVGKSVTIAAYTQLGENLEESSPLIEEAMRLTGLLKGDAADLLHRFLFTRDDLEKPVAVLSGGEKARLQLAALVVSGADMLLLDEPTNHLDIGSREAVEDALEEFAGTLVVISHDRYFVNKIADRVLYFNPPQVTPFEGNFSEFWAKIKSDELEAIAARSQNPNKLMRMDAMRADSEKPKKPKPARLKFDPQRFKELEREITRLEGLLPEIQDELEKLDTKGKQTRADRRRQRLRELEQRLDQLYAEWLELGERKRSW